MIQLNLDLFYDINNNNNNNNNIDNNGNNNNNNNNTVNEHNQIQTHYLSLMFLSQFDILEGVIEKVLL